MDTAKWIITGLILVLCLSCAREEPGEELARVDDYVITEQTLQDRIEGMPPYMKQQISTPEGRRRFIEALVEEEVIVREALKRGLDATPEFKKEMEMRERDFLVRLFYDKVIMAEAAPPDSEVTAYYQAHMDDYAVPEHAIARHILLETRKQAVDIKNRIEAGDDFGELAREYSLDEQTRMREGLIHGRVERDAPIRGLGDVPELTEAIFSLKPGEVSEPIKTDLGYHLVRVDELNPKVIKPLEEVRRDITVMLTNTRQEGVRDRIIEDLKAKYNVAYNLDIQADQNSPEGLFRMASEESDPQKKIKYYQRFIEDYPDNERTYEAKFMVGFTLAEEVGDFDRAEQVFNDFLAEFPETDLSDDARWMLENMRSGKQPDFDSE
jgi:peptidyl-prolyl cis-trans isomerase C